MRAQPSIIVQPSIKAKPSAAFDNFDETGKLATKNKAEKNELKIRRAGTIDLN